MNIAIAVRGGEPKIEKPSITVRGGTGEANREKKN